MKSSKFSFHLGFPRVASNGTTTSWTAGTFARTRARTTSGTPFLLEVLVKARPGISATGLIAMESSSGPGALKMCLDSSLIELVEVSLPIASPVLGKVATDRSGESRLIVVWIKNIEQGRTDVH